MSDDRSVVETGNVGTAWGCWSSLVTSGTLNIHSFRLPLESWLCSSILVMSRALVVGQCTLTQSVGPRSATTACIVGVLRYFIPGNLHYCTEYSVQLCEGRFRSVAFE
jgi:hypothetical protein